MDSRPLDSLFDPRLPHHNYILGYNYQHSNFCYALKIFSSKTSEWVKTTVHPLKFCVSHDKVEGDVFFNEIFHMLDCKNKIILDVVLIRGISTIESSYQEEGNIIGVSMGIFVFLLFSVAHS